ncbi:uncharacterized protein L199_005065 [Kwoniella botswanensis]|uniref:uncharacterized protein n=1 Tax=Kwoniella botswanensis TaxID=1268659 RepID=UPI00315D2F09
MSSSGYSHSPFANGARPSHNHSSSDARPARSTRYDLDTIFRNFTRFFTDRYGHGCDQEGRTLQERLTELQYSIQAGRIDPGILEEGSRPDFYSGSRGASSGTDNTPASLRAQHRRHTFEGFLDTEGPDERHQAPSPTYHEYSDDEIYSDDDYEDFDDDDYDHVSGEEPRPQIIRRHVINPSGGPVRSATWSFSIGPESSARQGLDGSIHITSSMTSNGQSSSGHSHQHHFSLPPGLTGGYGESRPYLGRGYRLTGKNPRYHGGGSGRYPPY